MLYPNSSESCNAAFVGAWVCRTGAGKVRLESRRKLLALDEFLAF
jgi:hypothetical protein